jgi:predicted ABC-type transport system involved in lysophospholipase L1 biosynthesis ATPase subunit
MATTLIIEARGLAKTCATGAQRVEALRGSDFAVQQQGEMVAIRAPPGRGKTILLNWLWGLDDVDGTVRIAGCGQSGSCMETLK